MLDKKVDNRSRARCPVLVVQVIDEQIGRSSNLGGNESYSDLSQPFYGFPDGVEVDNGFIATPNLPGRDLVELICEMRKLSA